MKGIRSLNGMEPGDLFTTDGHNVWKVVSYSELPTITLLNMETGEQTRGGVGCRLLADFIRLVPEEKINAGER